MAYTLQVYTLILFFYSIKLKKQGVKVSIKFYKTILLVVFCLSFISPIKLQAYCQFEGCGDSSNLDEAPLTIQEAQEIKEFYTSVERDLSENLEVLQDGTYQVRFSDDVMVAITSGAVFRVKGMFDNKVTIVDETRIEEIRQDRIRNLETKQIVKDDYELGNNRLKKLLEGNPRVLIEETPDKMTAYIDGPRGNYRIGIFRKLELYPDGYKERYAKSTLRFYRKVGGKWIKATQDLVSKELYLQNVDVDNHITTAINSLQSRRGFNRYLRARNITWPLSVNKLARAGRFVGRWTFRAVLAGASIVGGQLLFDYAQENHPEETGLVIAITKEQWEILSTNVRGIIEELSENNVLNELEL